MDFLQPESDGGLSAHDPLEVVEYMLNTEAIAYERVNDSEIAFTLVGDWRSYDLWFVWRPEVECLQICLSFDRRTEGDARARAAVLANLVNQRLWHGHYEIWTDEGDIIFRQGMVAPEGERPSPEQAASMMDAAVEAADRYLPAFQLLLDDDATPEAALAACLFETIGQA